MRTYTDADRIAALAALEANAGNATRTARELGIPKPTLLLWRDKALAAGSEMALTAADRVKTDFGALFEAALVESIAITRRKLPSASPKDAGIISGILSDKYLDHTQGRKTGVMVDQSQTLNLPPGTTLEDLRALRDGLRIEAAQ